MSPALTQDVMYRAVATRDPTFEGAFFIAVKTTGVFCKPGCPARTPRRENLEFFPTAGQAIRAGYRACRRCRPLDPPGAAPPWLAPVLALIEREPARRLGAADLRALRLDPARVTRYFKSTYGMTFQAFHRARRIGVAVRELRAGALVSSAALSAGFESAAGLRDAFSSILGAPPSAASTLPLHSAALIETPIGPMLTIASERGVILLEWIDRRALAGELERLRARGLGAIVPQESRVITMLRHDLTEYFAGRLRRFATPIDASGTPFQHSVWNVLGAIPFGEVRSYAEVARSIGRPTAVRAVARANGDNQLALLIPCHRVVGSDGSLTGYGGGLWRKEWLLAHEGARLL